MSRRASLSYYAQKASNTSKDLISNEVKTKAELNCKLLLLDLAFDYMILALKGTAIGI